VGGCNIVMTMPTLAVCFFLGGPASTDLLQTLEKADQAEQVRARKILHQVVKELRDNKDLPVQDRDEIRQRLARLLPLKAQTPGEVKEVLGPDLTPKVSRQILLLVFDCPRGQEPRLQKVLLLP
jgi:hypothetical protein